MSLDPSIFVVVPAYNEAEAIGGVLEELRRTAATIVVVDDCSTDDTVAIARAAGATVLRHAVNRGQGAALQTGLRYALLQGAKIIVTFDSDGQHDAADLAALVAPIRAGRAEFVLGSRFLEPRSTIPPARRFLLKLAVVFTRLTSGLRVTDAHNGLRALSRRAASSIDIKLDRMAHASELMDQIRRGGLPYAEVAVSVRYTPYARRKGQRGVHALRVAFDYLVGRWVR
ncbi:MAG: glycosyltransferase family 2 protein [Acidobacteriota bacterium]